MSKRTITISAEQLKSFNENKDMDDLVLQKLLGAAKELIQQNHTMILRDLAKVKADDDDGKGELPVTVNLKLTAMGRKVFIDASIEWKRTKKCGDSLDPIILAPDQKDLPLGV